MGTEMVPENKPAAAAANLNESFSGAARAVKDDVRSGAQKVELDDVVGLFGTCGNSHWRDGPMQRFDHDGIKYFNPVVPNWTPECAKVEAHNLSHDRALLFVVTGETEAYGSLAETGWAENSSERNGQKTFFVIDDYVDPQQGASTKLPANRARTLVRAHAKEQGVPIYPSIESAVEAVEAYMHGQKPKLN